MTALTAASLTLAPPASAAGGIVPYNGACGSGYSVIDHRDISLLSVGMAATVYLTYNGAKNCVVTINSDSYKHELNAAVSLSGGAWQKDDGYYYHYAGPVYTGNSAGQCVDWIGGINGVNVEVDHSHCR
ncbi:hypothetical protein [Streptomyces sp. NPDC002671]